MLACRFVRFDRWPRTPSQERRHSAFRSNYKSTLDLLEKEIGNLCGRDVIIQTGMDDSHLRNDGWPRANAPRPSHPGVMLTFGSVHGQLTFCCDIFRDWEDNLRGIALTLERLRMADLYGVTTHGEQYTGWKALPAAPSAPMEYPSDIAEAAAFLSKHSGVAVKHIADGSLYLKAYREASKRLHPDCGGSQADFVLLQQYYQILKAKLGT